MEKPFNDQASGNPQAAPDLANGNVKKYKPIRELQKMANKGLADILLAKISMEKQFNNSSSENSQATSDSANDKKYRPIRELQKMANEGLADVLLAGVRLRI